MDLTLFFPMNLDFVGKHQTFKYLSCHFLFGKPVEKAIVRRRETNKILPIIRNCLCSEKYGWVLFGVSPCKRDFFFNTFFQKVPK